MPRTKVTGPRKKKKNSAVSSGSGEDEFTMSESSVSLHKGGHRHKICTYSAVSKEATKSIYSRQFVVGGHNWQLVCYPGGETSQVDEFVSLFLGYRGPDKQCRATWLLRLVNQEGGSSRQRKWDKGDKYNLFEEGRRWGWQRFIKRSDLEDESKGYLKNDTIILEAELTVHGPLETVEVDPGVGFNGVGHPLPKPSLAKDMENFLHSEEFSDTELIFEGGECVRAHSQILAMRSPVFGRMFNGKYSESKAESTGFKVNIVDFSPAEFRHFLNFVYTGQCDVVSVKPLREMLADEASSSKKKKKKKKGTKRSTTLPITPTSTSSSGAEVLSDSDDGSSATDMFELDLATRIMEAADKYEVGRLRLMCEHYLASKLSLENAVNLLLIADRHSVSYLKTRCLGFIAKNAPEVMKTDGYGNLSRELLGEVIQALTWNRAASQEDSSETSKSSSSRGKKRKRQKQIQISPFAGAPSVPPSSMTTVELRKALMERGLPTYGNKNLLVARIQEAIDE